MVNDQATPAPLAPKPAPTVAADTSGIIDRVRAILRKPPIPQQPTRAPPRDARGDAAGGGQAASQGAGGASSLSKQPAWRSRLLEMVLNHRKVESPASGGAPGGASATTKSALPIPGDENQAPSPPSPSGAVYQPVVEGTSYSRADYGGRWALSSFRRDNTTLSPYQHEPAKACIPAAYEDRGGLDDPPPQDMTLGALEKAFNDAAAAAQDPHLQQVKDRYGSVLDRGDVTVGDEEEDARERPDPFMIDPVEATAEALNDAFFKGASWASIQRERPKIPLFTTRYHLEEYGKS